MQKLDLTKHYKTYYKAHTKPEVITIESAQFLSIQGKGDPSSDLFTQKIQALYAVAYTLKFACKALDRDFVVAKLEGLWRFDEKKYAGLSMQEARLKVPRRDWEYRLLIRLPEYVNAEAIDAAVETVIKKKKAAFASEVKLFNMHEGKVVQMLHVGAFDSEPETLQQMYDFMHINKLTKNGLHHEIYLTDFNKTKPEKLRTILREPVK